MSCREKMEEVMGEEEELLFARMEVGVRARRSELEEEEVAGEGWGTEGEAGRSLPQ